MLIGGVDAVLVRAPSLDEGLAFYRDALGHALLWRTADAAGLAMEWSDKLVAGTWLKKTRRSSKKTAKVTRKQTDNRCGVAS